MSWPLEDLKRQTVCSFGVNGDATEAHATGNIYTTFQTGIVTGTDQSAIYAQGGTAMSLSLNAERSASHALRLSMKSDLNVGLCCNDAFGGERRGEKGRK